MTRFIRRVRQAREDERGMMLIFAGLGLIAFMSASMLALDVGMFMVARSQAQAAADSGALAGAIALAYDDWDDRTPTGPAVQSAIKAATSDANAVMREKVSVLPSDVTFPAIDRVRVRVLRTTARGNPLLPILAPMFGIDEVDMGAVATAQAAPANAMTCVKPFTVPDKWEEHQTGTWDPTDTFERYYDNGPNKGQLRPDADVYIPRGQPGYTGYDAVRDRGTRVVLKATVSSTIEPGIYFPIAIGGVTGASEYDWNIGNCNTTVMGFDEPLVAEPGNMVGPTATGMEDLLERDPTAEWDVANRRPVSKMSPSPRVVIIPVFDPAFYDKGKREGRTADFKVVNYIGFFIERMQGKEVVGRITPVSGLLTGNGPAPNGAFPKVITLVQ